ncbi:hypothetical protein HED55_26325 [Ochrobactrum haematophilum]|uniref:protein adenylyltransferase n=1 Tax=Brucella haematophila TaxID=419474 RepID=A0ABX1DR09_9HYPH|nr:hypothetical protein [Brucella haematophila]
MKAIHGHIFQDIYEWAGHTRNESPVVDGQRGNQLAICRKAEPRSYTARVSRWAWMKPLDRSGIPKFLRGSSVERFAEIAGKVLAELNYVHPFREGNGRTQEALDQGVFSAAVIINILARKRDPQPAAILSIPDALRLTHEPVADCARYDSLRRAS